MNVQSIAIYSGAGQNGGEGLMAAKAQGSNMGRQTLKLPRSDRDWDWERQKREFAECKKKSILFSDVYRKIFPYKFT